MPTPSLTPKQIAVLEALLSGSTLSAAADAAGIHRSTVHAWRMQPDFRSFYELALRTRAEAVHERMAALSGSATALLERFLEDESLPAALRLKAAIHVVQSASRMTPEPKPPRMRRPKPPRNRPSPRPNGPLRSRRPPPPWAATHRVPAAVAASTNAAAA